MTEMSREKINRIGERIGRMKPAALSTLGFDSDPRETLRF
jgi:hypothetical protein